MFITGLSSTDFGHVFGRPVKCYLMWIEIFMIEKMSKIRVWVIRKKGGKEVAFFFFNVIRRDRVGCWAWGKQVGYLFMCSRIIDSLTNIISFKGGQQIVAPKRCHAAKRNRTKNNRRAGELGLYHDRQLGLWGFYFFWRG